MQVALALAQSIEQCEMLILCSFDVLMLLVSVRIQTEIESISCAVAVD